jgi:hypothetical protein
MKKKFDFWVTIDEEIIKICNQDRFERFQANNSLKPEDSSMEEFEVNIITVHDETAKPMEGFHKGEHAIFGHYQSKGTFSNVKSMKGFETFGYFGKVDFEKGKDFRVFG